MDCKKCGQDKTSQKLKSDRGSFQVPFRCDLCGCIKLDYQPVRDVLIVWKYPAPEKAGVIHLLEDENFRGGSTKEYLRPSFAVVLAIGPGYFHPKWKTYVETHSIEVGDDVFFNKQVPWNIELESPNGKKYAVTFCGFSDVYGIKG